jgi:hypothetical protein
LKQIRLELATFEQLKISKAGAITMIKQADRGRNDLQGIFWEVAISLEEG